MTYTICPAVERHLAAVEEIEHACFSLPWTHEQFLPFLSGAHHRMLVAEDEQNRVLGFLCLMHVLDEGEIANVAVSPAHRRLGVADALMEGALRAAQELGLAYLGLEVRESNLPAISLYHKYGFVPVGRRRHYYDAPREDAILMSKKWETRQIT